MLLFLLSGLRSSYGDHRPRILRGSLVPHTNVGLSLHFVETFRATARGQMRGGNRKGCPYLIAFNKRYKFICINFIIPNVIAMDDKMFLSPTALRELQQRIADFEDEASYKKLFFYFFLPLKSFSFSIIKSKPLAEEVVSDVLIEIWARRKRLAEIDGLKMYLYVSVKNASLRKLKQSKNTKLLSLDEVDVEFASSFENAETILLTQELAEKIDAAIQQLPQRCKLIFKLAKEDKLKYKEIALLLNISIKTIDHQVSIAIKKIAEVLHISLKKPSTH